MQEFATRKTIAQRMDLRKPNCLLRKYRTAVRIMKLTAILLAACLQLSARGITQTVTITVKDAPLFSVLKAIEKQTDFTFIVNSKLLQKARPVSVTANNLPLLQVLEMCFKDQPLTYKIIDKVISVIVKENKGDKTNFVDPLPKNIDVSGKVMDESGGPLAGANVVEKGKQHGTTTNAEGLFVLKGVDENGSLEISYIGYQTLTVPVNNRTSIVVSIKQSDASLQEVVINKGYYNEAKKFSTGNVAQVTSKEIERQPVQNPLLALQGRVPGIQITQLTGMPGGGVTARIQGQNSIRNGLEPFIVIDGVPFPSQLQNTGIEGIVQNGSPLNYINPGDIESIEVLKDADATAIYGSRAANGAILITTKKGKAGKTKFDVNLQQGWGEVGHFVKMMNTSQYLNMRKEAFRNDGISVVPSNQYDLTLWDITRYTDWQKTLIGGKAQCNNINAKISGGNSNTQYLIGGTYNRRTTVFPGGFDDKNGGIHFNISSVSTNQKFRVLLSGNYVYDQNHLPGTDLTQQALLLAPDAPPLYNDDGSLNWAPNASGSSTWTNPLSYILSTDFNNITKNLITSLNLSYNILPNLVIRSNFGYTNLQSNLYIPRRIEANRPEIRATSDRTTDNGSRNMSSWIIEPTCQYNRSLGKGKVEGLVGVSIQQNSAEASDVFGSGYSSDLLMKTLSAARTIQVSLSSYSMSKFNAFFGRLNYIWDSKYIINVTGRRDGSSKFGDANKLHNFGSVGLGWLFTEEKWLQQYLPVLSFGKLRASYGTTGSDQIGDFGHLSLYNIVNPGIAYQNTTGLQPAGIPNSHLQWEETRKLQCGLDIGVIKDRIVLGATYTRNRSSNQLIGYVIPSTTGFTSITQNLPALIQNTSWEFTLNTINIKGKNLVWTCNFNITIPRNKLMSFPGIEKTTYASGNSGIIVGQPLGVIKTYKYAGVDLATGNYQVYDKDGNRTTTPNSATDKTALISTLAKYYGGMQQSISFKRFQLDFIFQFVRQRGSKDLYYFNGYSSLYPPGYFASGNFSNQPVTVLNHWQKQGQEAEVGKYSSKLFGLTIWPQSSDAWYSYDASFIRLKNLSLSWQLPIVWTKRVHLQNARVYFSGQNLATITKYTGLDSENLNITTLPPLKVMTVGVKIEL